MPVRMKKDPENKSGKKDNYPGRGTRPGKSGDSPISYLLPMVLKIFGKNPKLLIVVAVIAGGIYFFGGGCGGDSVGSNIAQQLDYSKLNSAFNAASGNYANKVQEVVGNFSDNVNFSTGMAVEMRTDLKKRKQIGIVLSLDKQ
jgi:hypothetical protein